jgi:hypothetical protein
VLAILVVALLLVSGCRLDVVATAELERDGSGTLTLAFRLDDALLTELDRLAIDPTIEVMALSSELEDWELDRTVDEDAAITITLTRGFEDAAEMGDALRELFSGLSDDDPALFVDLDLRIDPEGAAAVDGGLAFRPPTTIGAELDGEPLGLSSPELAELTAEMVRPRLEVQMPGPIETHDADDVDGRTLRWDVPVGDSRTVSATSSAPGIYEEPWLWAAVAGGLALVAIVVLLLRRRR